ncbi:DUF222 domain-containing protein [Cellulomonas sp. CW35]|uniref:HNH endonuclease signature motif containing protein n=1 Tax=Cellulomonas sp. CW35 TaxID=3458249 RepID=UPI0022824117
MFEADVVTGGAARAPGAPGSQSALALLERAHGSLRSLAGSSEPGTWDAATRARAIRVLDGLAAVVTAVRAPLLVAQHAAAAEVANERGFVDTRARQSGASRAAVARELGAAHAMAALPHVGRAVAEHVVPVGHLDVLGRTLTTVGPRAVDVLARPETQRELVELARQTDAREFARSVGALVAQHEPDVVSDAREAARRARFLTLTHGADGTYLRGRLDPLSGHALARALDATGHRADDDRTGEQARADALTALAHHALTGGQRTHPPSATGASAPAGPPDVALHADDGQLPDGAARAPAAHVSLLVPAEAWLEVRERARSSRSAGDGLPAARGAPPGDAAPRDAPPPDSSEVTSQVTSQVSSQVTSRAVPRVRPAVSDDGVVLTRTELAAALCDCAMARVVMSASGLPLDVGRSRRMFTPAQRLAVVARDRLCAWNGCSTPARYSQVHHIRWWHRDGGPSDLENSVLLCGFHHHEVHRLDLDVRRLSPVDPPRPGRDADDQDTGPTSGIDVPARYEFLGRSGRVVNGPGPDPRCGP